MQNENAVKGHILKTTIAMLENGFDLEAMTIRKIALKANVSVGLIHYHFGSKDGLLLEATRQIIDRVSVKENLQLMDLSLPPKERLRKFLSGMTDIVLQYESFSKTMLRQELLSNSFATPNYILPILKEIQPMASDEELKWLSIVVVAPLQYIFLKSEGFKDYMQSDLSIIAEFIEKHLDSLGV